MKKLVLGSLLLAALASQTTGCIITTDDDPEVATITADWSFHTVSPTGDLAPGENLCPSGFPTVELHTVELDANDRPIIGTEFTDLFDCDRGADFTDPLPPGVYEAFIRITNDSRTSVYAESLAAIVDVRGSDKTFGAQIIDNGGYWKIGWDVRELNTNAPLTCRDLVAGQDRIGITATLISNTAIFVADDFDCELGEEFSTFSAAVAAGEYDVAIQPVDSSGGMIPGTSAVVLQDKLMRDRNAVTDLGVVMLQFP